MKARVTCLFRCYSNQGFFFLFLKEPLAWELYLEDFGAIIEGVWVADVIHQADDVTGQVGVGQVVQVREHFMKLRRTKKKYCLIHSFKRRATQMRFSFSNEASKG